MKQNKAYIKWLNLIDSKRENFNAPWSESEIIYFRKAIGLAGINDVKLRSNLLDYFNSSMPDEGFNITLDQKEKGINYLLSNTYKKNGTLRKNNIFGTFELNVLKQYEDFKLISLYEYGNGGYYLPVYRCISKNGSYFDYLGTVYSQIKIFNTNSTKLKVV